VRHPSVQWAAGPTAPLEEAPVKVLALAISPLRRADPSFVVAKGGSTGASRSSALATAVPGAAMSFGGGVAAHAEPPLPPILPAPAITHQPAAAAPLWFPGDSDGDDPPYVDDVAALLPVGHSTPLANHQQPAHRSSSDPEAHEARFRSARGSLFPPAVPGQEPLAFGV
jgi:hypothetical protein